jgi:hypothetical protein
LSRFPQLNQSRKKSFQFTHEENTVVYFRRSIAQCKAVFKASQNFRDMRKMSMYP